MSDAKARLIIAPNASYLKVAKAKKMCVDKTDEMMTKYNPKRGSVISGFSRQAKNDMMFYLMRILRDCLPCFVTLTYPKVYSTDAKTWKRNLKSFIRHLGREFPSVSGVWKLEPQKRGAPHYHLLIWGVPCQQLRDFVPWAWYSLVGNGDLRHLQWHQGSCGNGNIPCVQEVHTQKAMYQYVVKYISKSAIEGWKNVGKWWGIFYRERLPVAKDVVFEITDKDVVQTMRLIRRFTGYRSLNTQSRQVCCDASQWMEKLQTVPTGSYREWLEKLKSMGL